MTIMCVERHRKVCAQRPGLSVSLVPMLYATETFQQQRMFIMDVGRFH